MLADSSLSTLFAENRGGVPSVYPLYTAKDLIFDPALIGVWQEDGEDVSWTFTKLDGIWCDWASTGSWTWQRMRMGCDNSRFPISTG